MRRHVFYLLVFFQALGVSVGAQSFEELKIRFIQSYFDSGYNASTAAGKALEKQYPGKITGQDLYRMAIALIKTGHVEQSCRYLEKSIEKGFFYKDVIENEKAFAALHHTKTWEDILQLIDAAVLQERKKIKYPAIADELKVMRQKDQEIRMMMEPFFVKGVAKVPDSLSRKLYMYDSLNLIRIKQVIQQIGWPGKSLVGADGSNTAWLIIQHADKETLTQEKFLAYLQQCADNGDADPQNLAYLTDRVLRKKQQPQYYGTQSWINPATQQFELCPIRDASGVNRRRMLIGLAPLKLNHGK